MFALAGSAGSLIAIAAFTPGTAFAAKRSIAVTLARGCGEPRISPYSMPGRMMSEVYFARPEALSGPSSRLIDLPRRTRSPTGGQLRGGPEGGCCACCCGCGCAPPAGGVAGGCCWSATLHPLAQRRFEDANVGPAAADVAVERALGLLGGRIRRFLEQCDRGGDEPRRAEAAHQPVLVAEGLLDGVENGVLREALDGADPLPLRFDRQCRAGVDRLAVRNHRAGAAGAAIAHPLRAGDRWIGPRAQRVEQRHSRLDLEPVHLTVDVEADRHRARPKDIDRLRAG